MKHMIHDALAWSSNQNFPNFLKKSKSMRMQGIAFLSVWKEMPEPISQIQNRSKYNLVRLEAEELLTKNNHMYDKAYLKKYSPMQSFNSEKWRKSMSINWKDLFLRSTYNQIIGITFISFWCCSSEAWIWGLDPF